MSGLWIEEFSAVERLRAARRIDAADDEHAAVLQQGGAVERARLGQRCDERRELMIDIENLGAALCFAAGEKYSPIGECCSRMSCARAVKHGAG